MADNDELKAKVKDLGDRVWDVPAIEDRFRKLEAEGIPRKTLNRDEILANKEQILDRVQRRAEEYNFITKNCAQGTALAVMEEFGLGNMEAFAKAKGFEKCGLAPGIGARLAAEFIIESFE